MPDGLPERIGDTMIDLYKLTPMEALSAAIEEVAEEEQISKKLAKQLVINSLVYCCVIEEIKGQAHFLLEQQKGE